MYENCTKRVTFYLWVRISLFGICIWLRRRSGPFLGRFFDNLGLRAKWLCRFILRFRQFILWFFLPERIVTLAKINNILRECFKVLSWKQRSHMILTAGGLLEVQKGLNLVWPQTASGSFNIFLTASVTSASVSWILICHWGSVKLPVYSHIKSERRLNGKILQDIQQRKKSTPVKPLAMKALCLASCGANVDRSLAVSCWGSGCVLVSRWAR